MTRGIVVLGLLFIGEALSAAEPDRDAIERGKKALLGRSFNQASFPFDAYDNAWKVWGLKEKPADYDRAFVLGPYAEWYDNALRDPTSPTARRHAELYGGAPYDSFRKPFDEAARAFDAEAWADLFQAAGAAYVVFVTKHHDGYCLWPTDVPNPWKPGWNSDRDFVGELAAAVRGRGMRFGLYYSGGLDWTAHPRLIRNMGEMFAAVPTDDAYRAYALAQARELIDRYQPSVLWNDIAWPNAEDLPDLFAHYYAVVPDGVVNDRWLGIAPLFESLRDPAVCAAFNARIKDRIQARGLPYWADPARTRAGCIYHNEGGRGVYFPDPDGHLLEILTRPSDRAG